MKDGVFGYNTDSDRGADTFHPFSSNLKVETFNASVAETNMTITLSETPKKLIIMQAANGYGVSFPADANITKTSKPSEYYSYSYNGLRGESTVHAANSKDITFKAGVTGTVTVRYI